MSGIYIHIPFCKQACHYCDFHFSTSMRNSDSMVSALAKEISMRKDAMDGPVETIYLGGGTPSVLKIRDLELLIATVYENFTVSENPEITIEANPDDLNPDYLEKLARTKVNRLSIGIQSFVEEDLRMMNRAHNAAEAVNCLREATKYFGNISIDLIYGIPGMSNEQWKQNVNTALSFGIPHISSYALTVEPKTALQKLIATGKIAAPQDDAAREHFTILTELLANHGFIHYELSNFAKENYFSRNNSAYWLGKKYLGIGPSAHSYDGLSRSWNVASNPIYLKSIEKDALPSEAEILSVTDRYNEYIMTGLRTIWGISMEKVSNDFGAKYLQYLQKGSSKYVSEGLLRIDDGILTVTESGKFLTDGIAGDLFLVNLA
ncbi:coproporphyrinogen III oxidase [Flavobacterium magnum]|uniref:Heme chaperone HemW n=1 Tax=Flavobacterium magnum TaxID=2162713 RepID=A0A2S0RCW1_9FLAO|nr:radical SAM family heme chaperone HemW [Flavobacterium magnum]AWA28931.1 coproporphyrinogen III oxidase [Flavobacterium magnum]